MHFVTLTFDLIFIGGRGVVMDYLCAEFVNFSFSFIMRTDRIIDADDRYTDATTNCVRNDSLKQRERALGRKDIINVTFLLFLLTFLFCQVI